MYLLFIAFLLPLLLLTRSLLTHIYLLYKTRTLQSIPGPFFTRFTRLWYFRRMWNGHFEDDNIKLHKKYGSIVRIAPDHYSISDRAAIKTIYGTGTKFAKAAWYEGWKHPDPERWTLFPDRDIRRHGETRKRFSSLYSMSSLVHYEEFVDQCADVYFQRLSEFAERDVKFNLGEWFQFYAFDVIGEITYGQRFGFLDKGHDIDGTIGALQNLMAYSSLIGVYHEWHPRLFGPLSNFTWSGAGGRAYIMRYVQQKIAQHSKEKKSDIEQGSLKTQTFLEKMVLARDKDPEKVTDYHVFMMGLSNVIAGSDTTAISLSAIMYNLLHYPAVLQKLRDEIDDFTAQGRCSEKVTFKESQEMPYFQAVMKEALRMHSATGLPFWRVVPEGGAELSGHYFPEGTVVGVNAWVAHYDEIIFPNAKTFRPERWIEAEEDPARLKVMNEMYMPFGLGSRTCLGKHISILEMSKLIPQIIRNFDFETQNRTLETENYWFVKPTNFEVKVRRRENHQA
ncbi:cytochrome P450 [Aspergillus karnatakaensis]|uniref:cytochrome P450 n=1 Tax=Aspergillus karnatakaensis TaxID=1810916 RepID=UPI003CCCF1B9